MYFIYTCMGETRQCLGLVLKYSSKKTGKSNSIYFACSKIPTKKFSNKVAITMKYHFTPTMMARIKSTGSKCWKEYGEIETLIYC